MRPRSSVPATQRVRAPTQLGFRCAVGADRLGRGGSMREIRYDVDDPVATIALDRPDRLNALTPGMLGELRAAVDEAARDPAVVGIVITGAGRGFCSGLDAEVLRDTTTAGSSARPRTDDVPGLFTWLLAIPKPVIAAVNGVAAGG